jgi:hypothetical protein
MAFRIIIHGSKMLAAKLLEVSATPLDETSLLGSWHVPLFALDRRQCGMFCHEASRYCLFLARLWKRHFAELGSKWFRNNREVTPFAWHTAGIGRCNVNPNACRSPASHRNRWCAR